MGFIHRLISRFNTSRHYLNEIYGNEDEVFGRKNDHNLVDEGYVTNGNVYSINRMLALKASEIPINIISKDFSGNKEIINEGVLYDLLFNDPLESVQDKIEQSFLNVNLTGDLFFENVIPVGFSIPTKLKVLHSVAITKVINPLSKEVLYYIYNDGAITRQIEPQNIVHIKFYDPSLEGLSTKRGLSPLQPGYGSLKASNNLFKADASLLKNRSASGLISDESGALSANQGSAAKKLQNAINKRIGGPEKFGQYTVTSAKVSVTPLGLNSKDLELVKSHPLKVRDLSNIYGVDSSFFNDPENKTFNNRGVAEKAFILNGVSPVLNKILSGLSQRNKLYEPNVCAEADYNSLEVLQDDKKQEAEKNKIVSSGILEVLSSEIHPNQKKAILINVWGLNEDEIENLL